MNRLSREVLFNVSLSVDEFYALDVNPSVDLRGLLQGSNAAAVSEVEDQLGRRVRLHDVTVGRGASNLGVAVELLEPIAIVGGASAAVIEAARLVRGCYRRFARRTGRRPLISLGAAEHLALADLVDRASGEPTVFRSGDMCTSSPDRQFTGGDAFYVVLATETALHHYHVTAYGELHYIGTSQPVPHYMDIYNAPAWTDEEDNDGRD